jgi:exonuclease SbcD
VRFLHTADWHVGQRLSGFGGSRHAEHEAVLKEMVEIAVREKIDCLLVAGDMFHSRSPHPDDERIVFAFFAELIARKIPVVAICGNHDHPRRLAAMRSLLSPLSVHLCPEPSPASEGGIVRVAARNEQASIAALPWVPERYIVDSWDLLEPEQEGFKDYAERIGGMMAVLARGFGGSTVNLMMGHLFLNGAETSGSEWSVHVGLPYAVPPARIPATAQFVALGHLHRAQDVPGSPAPARYSGSPLQLDFGERDQCKSVTIIEARAGFPATAETIPLTAGRRLREVTGTLEQLKSQAVDFGDDYLRVFVEIAQPMAGLADQVRAFLPNAVQVRPKFPDLPLAESSGVASKNLTPEQQFGEWHVRHHQVAPPDALLTVFREVREEALHATA